METKSFRKNTRKDIKMSENIYGDTVEYDKMFMTDLGDNRLVYILIERG